MIVFTIIAILACLGIGTFALLNWQAATIVWAQPIVFVFGCLLFVAAGMLIVILIDLIIMNKEE